MSVSLIDGHIDNDAPRMTDNEIIKAFRLCHRQNGVIPCPECPYYLEDTDECLGDNNADILDLINRQKAEIERYEKEHKENFDKWKMLADKTKNHYEELYQEAKAIIKAEAVKEFIKRFEKKIKDVKFTIGQTWEIQSALKEVKKEMGVITDEK